MSPGRAADFKRDAPAAPVHRARVLDGKALAGRLEADLASQVRRLAAQHGRPPGLAVVLVGDDRASQVYVRRKAQACRRVSIHNPEHRLPATVTEAELLDRIAALNADPLVDGILVQLPLPPHIDKDRVIQAIGPTKDVDAFHPESVGHALLGNEAMAPCTPYGIMLLLDEAGIDLAGADITVVNHSDLIGKPLAALLMNREATVTVCHRRTRDVAAHTQSADIVVTGTGGKRLLTAADIRDGAVVVDVSVFQGPDGRLRGDAEPEVWDKAAWVTPVPGGVGPMTIAVLLQNTLRAFRRSVVA